MVSPAGPPSGSTARPLSRAKERVTTGMIHTANRTGLALLAYLATVLVAAMAVRAFEDWSVGDSIWWAFTTTTTVGYGDFYPETDGGRTVGVLTMLAGIVSIGVIVGRIASVVIRTHDDFTHEEQMDLLVESDEQIRLLRELHARMDALEGRSTS